jgi:hypothetical protein
MYFVVSIAEKTHDLMLQKSYLHTRFFLKIMKIKKAVHENEMKTRRFKKRQEESSKTRGRFQPTPQKSFSRH